VVEKSKWVVGLKTELKNLIALNTWEEIWLPRGKKSLDARLLCIGKRTDVPALN